VRELLSNYGPIDTAYNVNYPADGIEVVFQ
jgi:hypothetical protein